MRDDTKTKKGDVAEDISICPGFKSRDPTTRVREQLLAPSEYFASIFVFYQPIFPETRFHTLNQPPKQPPRLDSSLTRLVPELLVQGPVLVEHTLDDE